MTAATALIRDRLLQEFLSWLELEDPGNLPLAELTHKDPIQAALLLEEDGRTLHERGTARRAFAETINVVVQKYPYLKSFLAGPWRLLTTWESIGRGSSSSDAMASFEGSCGNRSCMAVASFGIAPLNRLLCLVEALRAHGTQSERLLNAWPDWLRQRGLRETTAGKIQNERSPLTKCETRRALRCRFYAEMFRNYGALRTHLVLLHEPVQDQTFAVSA